VEEAPEPSLIMWKNLGYTKNNQRLRSCLSVLLALVLVGIIIVAIFVIKNEEEDAKIGFVPRDGNCGGL